MKKKILINLVVSLVIATLVMSVACAPEEQAEEIITPGTEEQAEETITPGMQHYSGTEISFDYPEEWYKVGFNWEPGYEWGICFSGGVGDEPGVFVLRYALGDETLEQFTNNTKDIGYGPDFTISTPVETTVNRKPAYYYTYSGIKYGTAVQGDTIIIQNGESVWWIDFFATKAEYSENESNFAKILKSLVIE